MSFFSLKKKENNSMNTNSKYREGQTVKLVIDGIVTEATILKVFTSTAIVKTKDGECTTCTFSEILN